MVTAGVLFFRDSPRREVVDAVLEAVLSDLIVCRYEVFELINF